MKIGIGLPATIPGTPGQAVLDWARRADEGPFSSLGIIDRIAYGNYEPMITLAAAAGATRRIRLLTSVLLAPTRGAAVLAKEAASLDALSGGRLTLGLGVGGREDDFVAADAPFRGRGRRFEHQLQTMKRLWAGEALGEGVGPIGPRPVQPGGPPILIGGYTPTAVCRAARWGEGFISGGLPPDQAVAIYRVVEQAWKEAGRSGKPYFAAGVYYGIGPEGAQQGAAYLRDYYAFAGPMADAIASSIPTTPEALKAAIQAYHDAGLDEVIFWPGAASLDQVDRLADLVA